MEKRVFIASFIVLTVSLLSGCTNLNWWGCYVDAMGEQPVDKSYFVENRMPSDINPLAAKEYLNNLDITLSHLGYTKVDSANAGIK